MNQVNQTNNHLNNQLNNHQHNHTKHPNDHSIDQKMNNNQFNDKPNLVTQNNNHFKDGTRNVNPVLHNQTKALDDSEDENDDILEISPCGRWSKRRDQVNCFSIVHKLCLNYLKL